MKINKALLCLAASPFALFAGAASAQEESVSGNLGASAVDLFARDKNMGVRERPHPEYEARGLHAGTFFIYPRVDVSVEQNDNIYADEINEESDTIFRFAPTVTISSDWNRHSVQGYARGTIMRYSDFDLENTEDYEVGASGRVDVQRFFKVTSQASYAKVSEPRIAQNTPQASAEPIEYILGRAGLGAEKIFNRVRLSGGIDWSRYDYDDGRTIGTLLVPSAPIDQDARDREVYGVSLRGDYALSPDTAVFVQVSGNERSYDVGSTALFAARNSSGYEVLAGADFQVSNLVAGDAAVGYVSQDFDDVRFEDISSFGARMRLEWFPTQLTTVTGTVSRVVEDSVVTGAGGFLSTSLTAQVDHELRRNIILTGQLAYGADDFRGVDRNDSRWLGALSGTYLLNRSIGVSLSYSYLDQASDGVDRGREFTVQKVALSLVLQR